MPHHLLTFVLGRLAASRRPWLKNTLIRLAIKRFGINLDEARETNPEAYPSFNAFFTRALQEGARPLHHDALVSPADGFLTQGAAISHGVFVQAKGQRYRLAKLLGSLDESEATPFHHGGFFTIYLAPRDYHRVHMAGDGVLTRQRYIPGRLFSVNQQSASTIPHLFARNERLVCWFDGPRGAWVQILIGAMVVGGIQTIWHDHPCGHPRQITEQRFPDDTAPRLGKGAEMGRFFMGSTVVVLTSFPLDADFSPRTVRMGQSLGRDT